MIAFLFLYLLFLTPFRVQAATSYYAAPNGSGSSCSVSQPCSLTTGLSNLQSGDTLNLESGTYFAQPTLAMNGAAGAPITIQTDPAAPTQAVIDSGYSHFRQSGESDWQPVTDGVSGEYYAPETDCTGESNPIYGYVEEIPGYENQRMMLVPYVSTAQFRAVTDDGTANDFYIGPGVNCVNGNVHIRLTKTQAMKDAEALYGQVLPVDNANPNNYQLILSEASTTVTISGSYITLKNLTINPAGRPVKMNGTDHITFDGVTIWQGYYGIDASGTTNVTVDHSRLYGDEPYWIFWSDIKDDPRPAIKMAGTLINLADGSSNWNIGYSHLRGGLDAIASNTDEHDLVIHHNRIENCADDAMEFEGTTNVGKISVYENYIANCLTGIAPGQDTAAFSGPLYVYRNVFAFLRPKPINRVQGANTWDWGSVKGDRYGFEYLFKQNGSSYPTTNVHYYHNTMVLASSNGSGLNYLPKYPEKSCIADNIFMTINKNVNDSSNLPSYQTDGLVLDGNLYYKLNPTDATASHNHLVFTYDTVADFYASSGYEQHGIGAVSKQGTDPEFVGFTPVISDTTQAYWQVDAGSQVYSPTNFFIQATSPATTIKGIDLESASYPNCNGLPDTRNSRDMGAFPYGTDRAEYEVFPYLPDANPAPTNPGDIDGDGDSDFVDLMLALPTFQPSTLLYDFNRFIGNLFQ